MKTRIVLLSAALACGWLTWTAAAKDKNAAVVHTASFNAKFALTATPNAPAGARGSALIKAQNHDGNQTIKMLVRTHGLDPGDYVVSATQASDGTQVTLGQITVPEHGNRKTDTKDKLTVTADLVGADIGEITVSDTNGITMLQGDLGAAGSSGNLTATVPITGGEMAPQATGFARLKVTIRNGQRTDQFLMRASDVPPNSTFTVNVDGTDTGTVVSTRSGTVVVRKIPDGLGSINAVLLSDEGGAGVARADF
jgi:hypothetical protein